MYVTDTQLSTTGPEGKPAPGEPPELEAASADSESAQALGGPAGKDPVAPADAPSRPDPEQLARTRRTRADAIRVTMHYRRRLTARMLKQLEELLDEPTPDRFIGDRRSEDAGRQVVLRYQLDYMDQVLGKAHWTFLIHYTDGGITARVFVLIGNNLGPDKLSVDERTGRVIAAPEVEILAARECRGGISSSSSKGGLLMGTETVTLRRALAHVGPG